MTRRLDEACAGHGGVVLLAGEPGIGKTRTIAEVAETARAQGALVLWGRCYEGEAARPFGPFAEALGEYARTAAPEVLRADLGLHAAPLTRLLPLLRERLPDLPEPVALEPAEERVRLLDAVAQSLLALAARVPTVLVLDDLHWADAGTVALLRHVARFAPRARLLVLGAYRDVEVAAHHPLTEALGTLPRETSYEQLGLGGLDAAAVKELVDTVAEREMPAAWVETLTRETSGNPFFLREVLLHLAEEGALARADGSAPPGPESLRLPGHGAAGDRAAPRAACRQRRPSSCGWRRRSRAGSTSRWRGGWRAWRSGRRWTRWMRRWGRSCWWRRASRHGVRLHARAGAAHALRGAEPGAAGAAAPGRSRRRWRRCTASARSSTRQRSRGTTIAARRCREPSGACRTVWPPPTRLSEQQRSRMSSHTWRPRSSCCRRRLRNFRVSLHASDWRSSWLLRFDDRGGGRSWRPPDAIAETERPRRGCEVPGGSV